MICRTEGWITTFFLCPSCREPNTVRFDKSSDMHHFPTAQCKKCRIRIPFGELLSHYGPNQHSNLYLHCVEFHCEECGRVNFIKNEISRSMTARRIVTDDDPGEMWKPEEDRQHVEMIHISQSALPVHAHCQHCGQPHNVSY